MIGNLHTHVTNNLPVNPYRIVGMVAENKYTIYCLVQLDSETGDYKLYMIDESEVDSDHNEWNEICDLDYDTYYYIYHFDNPLEGGLYFIMNDSSIWVSDSPSNKWTAANYSFTEDPPSHVMYTTDINYTSSYIIFYRDTLYRSSDGITWDVVINDIYDGSTQIQFAAHNTVSILGGPLNQFMSTYNYKKLTEANKSWNITSFPTPGYINNPKNCICAYTQNDGYRFIICMSSSDSSEYINYVCHGYPSSTAGTNGSAGWENVFPVESGNLRQIFTFNDYYFAIGNSSINADGLSILKVYSNAELENVIQQTDEMELNCGTPSGVLVTGNIAITYPSLNQSGSFSSAVIENCKTIQIEMRIIDDETVIGTDTVDLRYDDTVPANLYSFKSSLSYSDKEYDYSHTFINANSTKIIGYYQLHEDPVPEKTIYNTAFYHF